MRASAAGALTKKLALHKFCYEDRTDSLPQTLSRQIFLFGDDTWKLLNVRRHACHPSTSAGELSDLLEMP